MKSIVTLATAATLSLSCAAPSLAQGIDPALAEARGRLACGAGTLISATYVGNGTLRVTCQEPGSQNEQILQESAMAGTALTTPLLVGGAVVILLIAVGTGSDDDSVATSTPASQPGPANR